MKNEIEQLKSEIESLKDEVQKLRSKLLLSGGSHNHYHYHQPEPQPYRIPNTFTPSYLNYPTIT